MTGREENLKKINTELDNVAGGHNQLRKTLSAARRRVFLV